MQVRDDPALLDLMMSDMRRADSLYRPTSYWATYEKSTMPELQSLGLRDFRRRELSTLASAGATDPWLPGGISFTRRVRNWCWEYKNRTGRRVTWPIWLAKSLDRALGRMLPLDLPWKLTVAQLAELAAEHCRLRGELAGAKPLEEFEPSMAGNPEGVFEVAGHRHTMKTLHYYLRYAAARRFIDLERVGRFVELGCGAGRQIELFRKLYPRMTFIASDIPPQLYVAEQFLSAIFPGSVVSYRDTRDLDSLDALGQLDPGTVVILPTWKLPLISGLDVDLFWNAASFQEMEPHVVRNYLEIVAPTSEWIFLQELFSGKVRLSDGGATGVVEPVVLEHYVEALPNFDLIDMSPAWGPLGLIVEEDLYHDSVWRQKREGNAPSGDHDARV